MNIEEKVIQQLNMQNQTTEELATNIGIAVEELIGVVGKLGEQQLIGMDILSMKWQIV